MNPFRVLHDKAMAWCDRATLVRHTNAELYQAYLLLQAGLLNAPPEIAEELNEVIEQAMMNREEQG